MSNKSNKSSKSNFHNRTPIVSFVIKTLSDDKNTSSPYSTELSQVHLYLGSLKVSITHRTPHWVQFMITVKYVP